MPLPPCNTPLFNYFNQLSIFSDAHPNERNLNWMNMLWSEVYNGKGKKKKKIQKPIAYLRGSKEWDN